MSFTSLGHYVTQVPIIIIIIFGLLNVVIHNGITTGVGIGVDSRDRDIITVLQCQDIVTFSTLPKQQRTSGNHTQTIVL